MAQQYFRVYNRSTPKCVIYVYVKNGQTVTCTATQNTNYISSTASIYFNTNSYITITAPNGYSFPENYNIQWDTSSLTKKPPIENTHYKLEFNNDRTVCTLRFIQTYSCYDDNGVTIIMINPSISLIPNVTYDFTPTYNIDSIFTMNKPVNIKPSTTVKYEIAYTENCKPLAKLIVNGNATDIAINDKNEFSITYNFNENDKIEIQVYTYLIEVVYSNEKIQILPIYENVYFGSVHNFTITKPDYIKSYSLSLNDTAIAVENNQFEITFDYSQNSVEFTESNITTYPKFIYNTSHCTIDPHYDYNIGNKNNFRIDFYSNENYIFIEKPYIETQTERGTTVEILQSIKVDDYHYYIVFYVGQNYDKIYVESNCNIDINALTNNFGCTFFYKITPRDIRNVFKKRFFNGTLPSGINETDLLQFVLACNLCYIDIETTYRDTVVLGFYNTEIETDLLLQNEYSFSLGKKYIAGYYDNVLDKHNSVIYVYLPYIDIVTIDSKYINTNIEITYKVDIVTNKCIAFIYSNDILIYQYSGVIGVNIPYSNLKQYGTMSIVSNGLTSNPMLLDIKPQIRVEYRKTIGKPLFTQNNYDFIYTQSGYFTVKNVELVDNTMTAQERNLLLNILSNGVYMYDTNSIA